jgi:ribosomal protein L37E
MNKKEINIDEIAGMLTDDPDIFVEEKCKRCGDRRMSPSDAACPACKAPNPAQRQTSPKAAPSAIAQTKRASEFY